MAKKINKAFLEQFGIMADLVANINPWRVQMNGLRSLRTVTKFRSEFQKLILLSLQDSKCFFECVTLIVDIDVVVGSIFMERVR